MEVWKDVVGYEGQYQVSCFGNVRGIPRTVAYRNRTKWIAGCELKQHFDANGYLVVYLSNGKPVKCKKVHRLVAEAFIPNHDNLPCVNHKDENRTNNNVANLEWCTHQYNNNYGTRTERARAKQVRSVCQYTRMGELMKKWASITAASNALKIHSGAISECCKGKRKTAGNFKWEYGD